MYLLSKDDLKQLMSVQGDPCISIFVPMFRASQDTQQNPVRFKNALRQAQRELVDSGMREIRVKELLEPAQELVNNWTFWQHQSNGLAAFLTPEAFHHYRLPLEFEELVNVGSRFHLKPLLPLFTDDGRFYVLALSQNDLRLLQCTRYNVEEIPLEDMPTSLEEALWANDPERQLQYHAHKGGRGTGEAVFHGQGVGSDDEKIRIREYFQQVDQGVHGKLSEQNAPLVLAGVEYLFPIYAEVNSYPHLLEGGIKGNPEELRAEELQEKAWQVVAPHFEEAIGKALQQYGQLANTEKATSNLRDIVPAAHYARVETLFVTRDAHQWGSFDPENGEVVIHGEREKGDEDLLDAAAVHTFLNGGTVYVIEQARMPNDTSLAAVFRY